MKTLTVAFLVLLSFASLFTAAQEPSLSNVPRIETPRSQTPLASRLLGGDDDDDEEEEEEVRLPSDLPRLKLALIHY